MVDIPARFDNQLELPFSLFDILHLGTLQDYNRRPWVSKGKDGTGSWQRMYRRNAPDAWRYWPEVEVSPPWAHAAIVLDVDRPFEECLGVAIGSAAVRPPNWITSRRDDAGQSHVAYTLRRPVLRGDGMRPGPMAKLARVAEHLREAYGADSGYVGMLTHNPLHPAWDTSWFNFDPYRLDELAECIPRGWRIPKKPTTAEGRNCTLFRGAMRWFGRPSNWGASIDLGDVLAWCEQANQDWFDTPLPNMEVVGLAKSVTKICRKNLASGQTARQFPLIQAWRGRKSARNRRTRTAERDAAIRKRIEAGEKQIAVALAYGVTQGRISQIINVPKQDECPSLRVTVGQER